MKIKIYLLILLFGSIGIASTSSDAKKEQRKIVKAINENYAYIPATESKLEHDYIIFKTEVSNNEYMAFIKELKEKGEIDKLKLALIDTSKWSTENWANSAYETYYHSHPAYRDYPVVNVSKKGAELFCEFITEKVNHLFKSKTKLVFRLPTHEEWIIAANGGQSEPVYSWGSSFLRNTEGQFLCNCVVNGAECIARDSTGKMYVELMAFDHLGYSGSYTDLTAPVRSYWPNDYGLYNMNGNVAEMVADKDIVAGGSWNDTGYDVRNKSEKPYKGAARTIGFRVVATVNPTEMEWIKIPKKKGNRE